MGIYNIDGTQLSSAYNTNEEQIDTGYDINGNIIFSSNVDYSNYSFTQKWASKGISSTQGFDIYDGKVFWVAKSGDSTVPANCYVWNLSDGSQALSSPYITVYSGHGNNVAFDYPKVYFAPAYSPSRVYENIFSDGWSATLSKTILLPDGTSACDACLDETDKSIMWSIGHASGGNDMISKWDLSDLTDNGDDTFTANLLQSVLTPRAEQFYIQGSRFHDGIFWYASGYSGSSTQAFVYGVNPNTGEVLFSIDCETTQEPEGVAWVAEQGVVGGYAMYVGFQGMMLRKYTFGALT